MLQSRKALGAARPWLEEEGARGERIGRVGKRREGKGHGESAAREWTRWQSGRKGGWRGWTEGGRRGMWRR